MNTKQNVMRVAKKNISIRIDVNSFSVFFKTRKILTKVSKISKLIAELVDDLPANLAVRSMMNGWLSWNRV